MLDAESLASLLDLPPEIVVVFIATLPIFELRGAIPVAMGLYGMPPLKSYLLAVTGNLIPVLPLLLLLEPVTEFLRDRSSHLDRAMDWVFNRTRRKLQSRYEIYGAAVLIPFVSIPLPITGAWTGCIAAFLFGIKLRYSLPAITLGVMIAGVIVTLATTGVISIYPV